MPSKTLAVNTLPKEALPETGDTVSPFALLTGSLLILTSATLYLLKTKKHE
nr:LPXTG cell wall anchor domain-containing protein [Lactococcus cremoris]